MPAQLDQRDVAELLDALALRPIVRILVNTNGIRLATDEALLALLARQGFAAVHAARLARRAGGERRPEPAAQRVGVADERRGVDIAPVDEGLVVDVGLVDVIEAAEGIEVVLGVVVQRRFVAQPLTLSQPRDVWRFLLLGAPVACLTNASIATYSSTTWNGNDTYSAFLNGSTANSTSAWPDVASRPTFTNTVLVAR